MEQHLRFGGGEGVGGAEGGLDEADSGGGVDSGGVDAGSDISSVLEFPLRFILPAPNDGIGSPLSCAAFLSAAFFFLLTILQGNQCFRQ